MTWQNAKLAAARHLEQMLRVVAEQGGDPENLEGVAITLTDYEHEEAYYFLKGAEEAEKMPYGFHKMVNGELARQLRKRRANVRRVVLKISDYFVFLETRQWEDSSAHRSAFVGLQKNAHEHP